jgi:hypothetical protein
MPLGKQFENTYWEDPETGKTHSWTRDEDPAGERRMSPRYRVDTPEDNLSGHQGLLFHPATGTGRKEDPLIPPERRLAAATQAVGGQDTKAYQSRVRQKTGRRISENMANKELGLLRDSLVDSGIDTRAMENVKVSAFLNPRRGGGFAEDRSDAIMVGRHSSGSWETIPEKKGLKTTPSERPIANPNFWKWYDKNVNDEQEDAGEDLLNHTRGTLPRYGFHTTEDGKREFGRHQVTSNANIRWQHSRTGEVLENSDAVKKAEGNVENLRGLGFVPNLFPGKGKSSNKVHAGDTFDFTKGYSYTKDAPLTSKMHSRFEPASVEEVTIPETKKYVKKDFIEQSTLVHEIGHQVDPVMADPYSHRYREKKSNRNDRWGRRQPYSSADPMEEGFADGYADRYSTMKDNYEDVLSDPSDPTRSISKHQAYGIDSSKWKNSTHKALYVASRVNARSSRGDRVNYPSRHEISKDLGLTAGMSNSDFQSPENHDHAERVNQMALGHMLSTNPRLMKHLETQGLGSTGKAARSAYLDAYRAKRKADAPEQLQFPGMED